MQRVAIVGASGHGREMLTLIEQTNAGGQRYAVVGFVDDRPDLAGAAIGGVRVIGTVESLERGGVADAFVLGVGNPATKRRIAERLVAAGLSAPVIVHPSVITSASVSFGRGSVICAGNVLTCDIGVGAFVTLNRSCTVGHDVTLGDFATIAPGVNLSGNVSVGLGADIGTGTSVIQGCRIGDWSIVGAGAAVTADLPPDCTAVGVPARVIKQRDAGWHLARR